MLRKLAVTAGLVTILGIAAFFAPHETHTAAIAAGALLPV